MNGDPVKIGDSLKKVVDGMDVDAEELSALRRRWELKTARIHREDMKRVYGLIIQVMLSFGALLYNWVFHMDILILMFIILVAMFISLGINQWVYFRVQRIIWSDLEEEP